MLKQLGIILTLLSLSCSSDSARQSEIDYIVSNVKIVDVNTGKLSSESDIYVYNGKIVSIEKHSKDISYPDSLVIDGTGKFVSPGLAEMHAHIPTGSAELTEETLFLYLSNGVTTIRGMLGVAKHLELRERAEKGDLLSPRIFTSGPSLNGNTVPTRTAGRDSVLSQKNAGYDFMKMHPGTTLEVFEVIDKVADSLEFTFSGHVSVWVGIERALKAPYASIDHLDGYFEGLVPEKLEVEPNKNGFFGFNFTDIVDTSRMSSLVNLTKENGVWVVPTQCLLTRWVGPGKPEALGSEPEMKYMSQQTRYNWISSKRNFISSSNYSEEKAVKFLEIRDFILRKLYQGGVGILLGSDAPQVFNVPGFSIQHELKAMADAGIPNVEIIRAGTLNPAIFFSKQGEFGSVSPGYSADFILLNSNPLDDIGAFRENSGVMVKGRWLSEQYIQNRLDEIATNYSK